MPVISLVTEKMVPGIARAIERKANLSRIPHNL